MTGTEFEGDRVDERQFQSAAKIVDRHVERLLRDLVAIGLLEVNNRPSADERLTAKLGEDLLRSLRAELGRLDASAPPIHSRPHHAA
jgi:hypothetical protein